MKKKEVVLNEISKELIKTDKNVLNCMKNICIYYNRNVKNIKEYFNKKN